MSSSQHEQRFPSFIGFVQKFNKHYQSQTEYLKRQQIYLSNIEYIKKSNCTSCGVNFFADWTQSQISGLRTVRQSPTQEKIGAFPSIQTAFSERRLTETIPQSFDWRNISKMTPVKYEGYCGASWAFSTVAFFEQESIMAGLANETLDLSEAYLIACNPENQGCKAGEIESSIEKVIDNRGLPLESQYPFNPDFGVLSTVCLENNFFTVPNVSRISYYKIYDPETIKRIIFKKPVIAAICGMELVFYFPSSNSAPGRTLKCKPQNRIIDHSVLLVGYTETQWIVKNHWGTGWGIDGYAYVSRNPSEDCCIGEQLHSSGTITAQCSIQYCQMCVEIDTCYKCESGRWVKHNTTTGVQTCEPCNQANCTECYNYRGTCKWCADGFALIATVNATSGKCMAATITNCNTISGIICIQCKPGYRPNSGKTSCLAYCLVKNCNRCVNGPCQECRPGFRFVNPVVDGKNTQFCLLNPCTIANCSLCNSTGQCVVCMNGFTLQTNGTCTTNCTAISNCIICMAGSTSCNECIDPLSFNSTKRACQNFTGTTNCRLHRTTCTSCRSGYLLTTDRRCTQICDSAGCQTCVKTDITICLGCYSGYYMINTTVDGIQYATKCLANPCNITNCTLCGPNGVGCVQCATKYLIYNTTSNICENLCKMENCRDCLTTGTTAGQCDFCNPGYCIDYYSKQCVNCSISNCLSSYVEENVQYCWMCMRNYYSDFKQLNCMIYCTDYYCELCEQSSLYACTKCFDGYFMLLENGALICTYIIPTLKGCEYVSFNQTYCHQCNYYYYKNNQTGLCQLNTKDCPSYCQYCKTNESYYFDCKCVTGVFQYSSEKCITSPFNDTDCYIVQLYGDTYYCMECLDGKIANIKNTGCDPACIVSNCTLCESGYNKYCWKCDQGFFLTTNWICQQCPFQNCKTCKSTIKCLECKDGYELAPNQLECIKIVCLPGFLFTGYECICPTGTYYTPLSCQPCQEFKCKSCSATKCYSCDISYYLTSNFQCKKCLPNCKKCQFGTSCDHCVDGFLYDTNTSQCISPSAQGGAFFLSETTVIQCPFSCLQCDNLGKCTQCLPGFSPVGGYCANCQGQCKTCQSTNATACTTCEDGYFLNQTSCVKCSDVNCEKCTISITFCEICKEGFYMENNTCKACMGSNCLSCNIYGECTRCSSGYGLTANYTCQQCAGNCIACIGAALNQCVVLCNSTQYQINGSCKNCPSKCLSCHSASICSSCVSGYLLRNGSCKPACAKSCYLCEQTNTDVCLQCFAGYVLSEVGVCNPDIVCNNNQSCVICPLNWTVINRTCEICNVDGNCIQCAPGNVDQCGFCKDGFFLNNSVCTACESSCLKCSSLERCQICKDGFLIPQGEVYGSCNPCDSTCKTCANLPAKCTSCKEGYQLSVSENCLRIEKIEGEVELDIAIIAFPTVSDTVRNDLVEMMGVDAENGTKYYVITELREGSVILEFRLAIPEGKDADATYTEFQSQLSNTTEIGGVNLIAVRKLEFFKPEKKQNETIPEPEVPFVPQTASINKLAIILGVVIPSVIIILAVIAFTFRRKLFRSRDTAVDNVLEEPKKNQSSQVVIHMRGKLPPIVSVHNTSFTPLKDEKMDDTTGKNRTYFNSTGFPQQQSYSKLQGFNDESRNEFDQTLNNIVAELNERNTNKFNGIAEKDDLNEFNEDLREIRGTQRGMMENEKIFEDMNNELMDQIQFNQNSLRKLNEKQEQSPEGNKIQVKGGEKGHLQIIEYERDQQQNP